MFQPFAEVGPDRKCAPPPRQPAAPSLPPPVALPCTPLYQPSTITVVDRDLQSRGLFDGISDSFEVARYHSLHGPTDKMPDVLRPTAVSADGVVRGF